MNPAAGLSYYRLKQLDRDGKFTYSHIVMVNSKVNTGFGVSPNPVVTNHVVFTHSVARHGSVIRIISGDGKTVSKINVVSAASLTQAMSQRLLRVCIT
jgi:hypothetical protein